MMRKPSLQRGFSLLELVFATGVLGVGLVGLIQLHGSAVQSVARGESIGLAGEIGAQRLNFLTTMHPDDVPACAGPTSCRTGGGTAFAQPLADSGAFQCTRWVDGADVPAATGAQTAQGVKFRIDTIVGPHPDPVRQPRARLVTVSVCWLDKDARVREIQARRLVVPGV